MTFIKKCVQFMMMALFLSPLLSSGPAYAAVGDQQIMVGNITGKAGQTVQIPITMKSNGNVTAIQLQISYDKNSFELLKVNKGSGLQSAFSVLANKDNGKMVIGSLGSVIGSGTKEVAVAEFKIKANITSNIYEVMLVEASFSDGDANNLSSQFQVLSGSVTVDNTGMVHVAGITVNPTTLHLKEGGATGAITAMITPGNASIKEVTWSSSDERVAVVVDGVVTPVAAGTATITATAGDGGFTATSIVTVQAGSGSGGGGNPTAPPTPPRMPTPPGTPTQPGTPTSTTNGDVIVNGKVENAGTATTTMINNQKVTTVVIDSQKLEDRLAAEADGALITIPVNTQSDVVIGVLTGQMIRNMQMKQATVEIKTENATYTLPAGQINIGDLAKQFGKDVELQDITIQIEIAIPTADMMKVVENSAAAGNFTIVVAPLNFTVRAIYDGIMVEMPMFNAYVERLIAIPEGIDPNKITTGAVVDPDGTIRHVPTKIVLIDGKYYAKVKSLTNSTYTIIYHPIEFQDATNHWAKDVINDMGSRMVISGMGNEQFEPNRDITRAEFAAIMIRGLGLKLESGANSFSDVKETDWYSSAIQTAFAYKLINGFEDGTFRPLDKMTREQAMVMIAKAMVITELKAKLLSMPMEQILSPFADASDASNWANSSIADSIQAGIVSGRNKTQLAPKANITRAEVAAIVQRLLQKSDLIQ